MQYRVLVPDDETDVVWIDAALDDGRPVRLAMSPEQAEHLARQLLGAVETVASMRATN
jgi:hypothetical protein